MTQAKRKVDIDLLIQQLTLEEKARLCSGKDYWHTEEIDRLGIPSILMCDGPHGIRKQENVPDHVGINQSKLATCYPTASTLACSFDKELVYQMGTYLGTECQSENISILLGPGINIKRSPLCGRNFEYYSEDPYLSGELGAAFIKGVQSKNVGTCLKHFVANNQEKNRLTLDTIIDERTLQEIYLAGFEKAVKQSDPWSVMCSYNLLNGEYASENKYLLTDILKEEWGHEGIVITDWGACNDRVEGIKSGNELEMPSSLGINDKKIVDAVKKGYLDEKVLNNAVGRLLKVIYKGYENQVDTTYDKDIHHKFARQIAAESIVLLKNDHQVLPIHKEAQVAIIGEFAKKPRYQGAGSSHINPTRLDNAYDEIVHVAGHDNVTYSEGYNTDSNQKNQHLIEEAVNNANKADVAIIFTGLPSIYESEGFDRDNMKMPDSHNILIQAISQVNKNVIVVLSNGGAIEMPWINQVRGVIECYLSGQGGGYAVANILYGLINPSGKLAESFPYRLEDNSSYNNFPRDEQMVQYREGIYVGYRYYDKANIDVLFPFGYGLSYTNFEYSDICVSSKEIDDTDRLTVKFKVKNSGKITGKEIIQVYVKDQITTIFRPEKELKAFEKVHLLPNEEKEVTIHLDKRAFAYYNVDLKEWCVETGEFDILVGASSRDIRLKESVHILSTSQYNEEKNNLKELLPSYYVTDESIKHISEAEFTSLYGKKIKLHNRRPYNQNTKLEEIKCNLLGKCLVSLITWVYIKQSKGTNNDETASKMMKTMMLEMPIRGLIFTSQGQFTEEMGEFLIAVANKEKRLKHFFRLIQSFIKKSKE